MRICFLIAFDKLYGCGRDFESNIANNEVNQYSEKLRRTVLTPNSKPISDQSYPGDAKEAEENDALKLMLVNMEEIKAYYTLSKVQEGYLIPVNKYRYAKYKIK